MITPATSRFPLLLLTILFLTKPALTAPPIDGKDPLAQPSTLQRRALECNPEPNQNLVLPDCLSALQQVPGGYGIGLPLGGHDPTSPYFLPREFGNAGCRITVQLAPELHHTFLSWATIRYRSALLVNLCVGGLGAWAPGHSNAGLVPGRGGNDTFGGVVIGVGRPWNPHNVQ